MKTRDYGRIFFIFCMAGFLLGILYTNIMSGQYLSSGGMFSEYYMSQYLHTEIQAEEYFWYILPIRILPLMLLALAGKIKFRRWAAAGVLAWTGFLLGILFTAAIMQLGIKGILVCLAALFPQGIFYAAGYGLVLWHLYLYPQIRWNLTKTIAVAAVILVGIILECYTNPIFMKIVLKTI